MDLNRDANAKSPILADFSIFQNCFKMSAQGRHRIAPNLTGRFGANRVQISEIRVQFWFKSLDAPPPTRSGSAAAPIPGIAERAGGACPLGSSATAFRDLFLSNIRPVLLRYFAAFFQKKSVRISTATELLTLYS